MQLCLFIHLSQKRAKTTALLDSGVSENFINMQYAKELRLPIKHLHQPQPVHNVDGMRNKNGDIEHYMDLEMKCKLAIKECGSDSSSPISPTKRSS